MLIIFGGLPGTGKSTLARAVSADLAATYVRIDSLEQAIRASHALIQGDIADAGYCAAYALAADNLRLGRTVVADSVNPIAATRAEWRATAQRAHTRFVEVEIRCSDAQEHRRRVESRSADIAELELPTWEDIAKRHYEPWHAHIVIDTATHQSESESICELQSRLREHLEGAS